MIATSRAPKCYCGTRTGLHWGPFGAYWQCPADDCDGRVGCHPGSTKPLGTVVGRQTRVARIKAHESLDALWAHQPTARQRRAYRAAAYTWLAKVLGTKAPHVGEMDRETAMRVAGLCARARPEDLEPFIPSYRATPTPSIPSEPGDRA